MDLLASVFGAALGATIPVVCFVFWLGGLSEKVKALCKKCEQRESDHSHHYERLNEHSVAIGKLDTRTTGLEQWKGEQCN